MVDQRDDLTWVIVELSHPGEVMVTEGTLEANLRRDLQVDEDHPIFIPCALYRREGRVTTIHLMEGYVFVASGLPDTSYYALEHQPYVTKVMSTRGGPYRMRALSVITNAHVQEMKEKLQEMVSSEIPVGGEVMVLEGTYRHLVGTVTGLEEDNAFVHIRLRSIEVIATVPRIFLEVHQSL